MQAHQKQSRMGFKDQNWGVEERGSHPRSSSEIRTFPPDALSLSSGEKPGFVAPRDLPKHTPLISKSQSLRSFQGAGSWTRRRPDEDRGGARKPRTVQRTQSVPARRPARRRLSAGPRVRPKDSLRSGAAPRGRPWTGASASLPRKPSVPWQRQLDQPRDRDQTQSMQRPLGKVQGARRGGGGRSRGSQARSMEGCPLAHPPPRAAGGVS